MFLLNILQKIIGLFKKKKRVYGWKRDKHDIRDFKYTASVGVNLPSFVDLAGGCPAVYDQGDLGSCTANAIGAAIEYDQLKENKAWDFMPSRLFIYYNERAMEGTVHEDSGAAIRDGVKSVNTHGVCKEILCPYIPSKFTVKPSEQAYKEAIFHKTLQYAKLDNTKINDLKKCLSGGLPFVFGFTVYEYFESPEMAKTGILKMPGPKEQNLGGHAVMCVGYDDAKKAFMVRNSWGPNWGQKGYFWMPYEYMTSPVLASDFWVINSVNSSKD